MVKPWVLLSVLLTLVVSAGTWVVATGNPQAGQAATTCACGCKGTPRPACAHSCGGNPCTGGAMTHSRIIVGEVVENQPATFSVVAANGKALTGFVVELDGKQKVTTDDQGRGVITPTSRRTMKANIPGVTSTEVRVISAQDAGRAEQSVPRYTTAGKELSVTLPGRFDGNASNTTATVGTTSCPVLFEAPHQTIVQVPETVPPGASTLRLTDQGRTFDQPIRVVRFSMQADKASLLRGESTQGKVVIEGADGSMAGGVIRIQNLTTEIVALTLTGAGGTDRLEKRIDAGMIRDNRIEIPLTLRGRRGGSFMVVGGLYDPQARRTATCSCGCKGTPRPACAHSCGGNPCTGGHDH